MEIESQITSQEYEDIKKYLDYRGKRGIAISDSSARVEKL